jgi:hypothetical protein
MPPSQPAQKSSEDEAGDGDKDEAGDEFGEAVGDELTEDELFEVLANSRRRYALHALSSTDEKWELGSLAEQIAAWENGTSVDEVSRSQRKSVYTALQQLHLPKMAEVGVVEYDKNRGTVSPTGVKDGVDIYLDVVRGDDIPWSEFYLGLVAITAALVVVSWLDIFPFSEVPEIAIAGIVVCAFGVSAVAHYHLQKKMQLGEGTPPTIEDR